ncbi:MAG: NAD-dependent dehydratase [Candidatus Andersenbacteria bacterium CG10_big_fil_rev_8_21_14_0_10_54_11]|uniref:UDP-glucuronate decarboxylase n=1 Tax=Candidatus Andersenbacteria bacterium CG10_big_fil_rev_8_21_14_0_10_54_11 TaxID=1974485 RepID=A0A2M6X0J3_9BACT|nr:MAG: NAD-dependent dehydratase [Candidatus Andersenbacteria bacterium CG10_big_fil_rev_8_21_14_0_10_54_11]
MTILVTGGAGFIGSHLCDRLIEAGNTVLCIDNFFTGQRRNIEHLIKHPAFTLIEHDIIEPLHLDYAINRIYNLACPASPVHYQFNPIRTIKANTKGVINMLGLAKKHRARILQASTSEVYGDPKVHPQPESYFGNVNPLGPRACYDEGKRVAETLCFDYHRAHRLDIRIVRIFNTFGPRMHPADGRVISNFITQALAGKSITLHGNGEQTRSFCYVDDLVSGLLAMMEQTEDIGPINLGNPEEISMKELAEKIIARTKAPVAITTEPGRPDDPRQRQPDITKAKRVLAWQPTTDLDAGLNRTVRYFQNLS